MNLRRREFLKAGAGGIALVATTACDQAPRELRALFSLPGKSGGPFRPPPSAEIDPIIHVLNRTGFGARPGDFERISRLGKSPEESAAAYLEVQLRPETIDDLAGEAAVRCFETQNEPLGELFEYQPELLHDELMRATLARAVFSERQLLENMVQFWSDHFNIDPSKGDCKWLKVADDREVIRKHALGKFPEMLRASALSPAMLWYLDGRVNQRTNPAEKPNENYARELLELHTLGVHGGYTQKDVMEVARCLTGWTVRSKNRPPYFQIGQVEFVPGRHDFGAKEFLGQRIPAVPASLGKAERERLGRLELERVLKTVTAHPATAKHIAAKLCRHFIADEPPAEAIAIAAEAFARTSGDIPATLRALFATDAFRLNRGTKFKRPFTFIASALRATDARTDASMDIISYLRRMGHAPFNYPSPDGYPDQAQPWMGSLLWRWNFSVALAQNRIKGTSVFVERLRENVGGESGLMAHLLGRKPTEAEMRAYHDSGAGLALLLACPGFQWC